MQDAFFQPVSGFDLPRFAGVPTFMRLPHVGFDHPRFGEVEIGLVGAPWDGGHDEPAGSAPRAAAVAGPVDDDPSGERGDLGGSVSVGALC